MSSPSGELDAHKAEVQSLQWKNAERGLFVLLSDNTNSLKKKFFFFLNTAISSAVLFGE